MVNCDIPSYLPVPQGGTTLNTTCSGTCVLHGGDGSSASPVFTHGIHTLFILIFLSFQGQIMVDSIC